MRKILQTKYIILNFSEIENSRFKYCLGVVGYLFLTRKSKNNISYIPASFIRSMESKCKTEIVSYLIDNEYIIKQPSPHSNKQYYTITGLTKLEKKDANLYLVMPKLRMLKEVFLDDIIIERWVDSHLHLLYNQNFNHYDNCYKWIKVIPPIDVRYLLDEHTRDIVDSMGDSINKDYDISSFGYDHKIYGTHINIFTENIELLKCTSLIEPINISLLFSIPVILADQLYKTVGENDYSDFFKKTRFTRSLVNFVRDYYIYDDIEYSKFYAAIYGYEHISEFKSKFKQTNDILWRIKNGGRGLEQPFLGFNGKFKILKNDVRLKIPVNHPAMKRGQPYYKIVPLICMQREVSIMRNLWRELKKFDIIFIPLKSGVVVEKANEIAVYTIFDRVLSNHIHSKLKFFISKNLISNDL